VEEEEEQGDQVKLAEVKKCKEEKGKMKVRTTT
jgi:hypothetical protein